MLSSLAMSSTTIKEIDFEVSQPWDDDGDAWDAAEEGGRFPRKRSLPAARPKTRHRSVGTTMAPAAAEELAVVGKGGRVRRTKVRQQHWEGGGGPRPNARARGRGGRNFRNRSRG